MQKRIQSIQWKRAHDEAPTDVTDAVQEGTISATRHPDDHVEPKGYTVTLTLEPTIPRSQRLLRRPSWTSRLRS